MTWTTDAPEEPKIPEELTRKILGYRLFLNAQGSIEQRKDRAVPSWRLRFRKRRADGTLQQIRIELGSDEALVRQVQKVLDLWQNPTLRPISSEETLARATPVEKVHMYRLLDYILKNRHEFA